MALFSSSDVSSDLPAAFFSTGSCSAALQRESGTASLMARAGPCVAPPFRGADDTFCMSSISSSCVKFTCVKLSSSSVSGTVLLAPSSLPTHIANPSYAMSDTMENMSCEFASHSTISYRWQPSIRCSPSCSTHGSTLVTMAYIVPWLCCSNQRSESNWYWAVASCAGETSSNELDEDMVLSASIGISLLCTMSVSSAMDSSAADVVTISVPHQLPDPLERFLIAHPVLLGDQGRSDPFHRYRRFHPIQLLHQIQLIDPHRILERKQHIALNAAVRARGIVFDPAAHRIRRDLVPILLVIVRYDRGQPHVDRLGRQRPKLFRQMEQRVRLHVHYPPGVDGEQLYLNIVPVRVAMHLVPAFVVKVYLQRHILQHVALGIVQHGPFGLARRAMVLQPGGKVSRRKHVADFHAHFATARHTVGGQIVQREGVPEDAVPGSTANGKAEYVRAQHGHGTSASDSGTLENASNFLERAGGE
uniref:Uncharacterized protein n=1 Tax=Anopheles coluzzii TaxID=1518534 RepID=A0A8W7Q2W9_ANOCL